MKYFVKFFVVTFFLLIYTHASAESKVVILDMKLNYRVNDNLSLKLSLNNLTNKDDVRLVGSPVSRRAGLFEVNYHL